MVGSASAVIMVTEAPMIPVIAARMVPMIVTATTARRAPLQQDLDRVEQVGGDPAALHHDAHEHERRDRDQTRFSAAWPQIRGRKLKNSISENTPSE